MAIYFAGSLLKIFIKPIILCVIFFSAWRFLQSIFPSRRRPSSDGYNGMSNGRRRFKFDDDTEVVDMPEDALRKEKKNEI